MVSNSSTFDQDLDWAGSELHKLGQLTGVGPQDVIPGVPATAAEVGEHLSKLGSALERAGQGIKSIDSGGWTGQAGDAFRANFLDKAPAEWLKAADALTDAGQAVRDYEQVLATEKPRAQRAKEELDQANEASRAALAKHNAAVAGGSGTGPGEFVDPGAEARARAQQEIAAAKAAVQAAGDRAADVVLKACQGAPDKPGPLAQIAANIADGAQVLGAVAYDFGSGVVEGVVGMAEGALGLGIGLGKAFYYSQPGMQFTDPEGYRQFNEAAATTVQSVVENPWQAVKTVVDVDGWKENPAKALGSMVPDAAAGLTGAGLASRVLRSTDHITDAADTASDISRTTDRVSELGRPDGTPPWADLDSAPPPRAPEAPANPWDGHEFGPKGSDPLPDPEPPQAPVPEPRNRHELPDWFDDDNTPDSWLDDGKGAPEPAPDPTPDPAPGASNPPPEAPPTHHEPPGPATARLDDSWRGHVDPADIRNERKTIEDLQRRYGPGEG
ncbi:putative T7SS-secreted protein [Saccharopolyspora sp. NPDC000359]|uniref:putative T7SS-secreted protein n=1 Tax=Saccharopolyspora sp. NPDC000359 TaxID=3154251 RepID=UPI0033294F6B